MSDLAARAPAHTDGPCTSPAAPVISGATNQQRYRALTEIRVQDPDAIRRAADARARRSLTGAVRGLVVGRTLLFPSGDDVPAAVDTAVSMVR